MILTHWQAVEEVAVIPEVFWIAVLCFRARTKAHRTLSSPPHFVFSKPATGVFIQPKPSSNCFRMLWLAT